MKTSINELNEKYDIELERILKEIKKTKAKKVLLQFPEGLKPYAQAVCDEIEKKEKCQCFIWLDSCYGACDTPQLGNVNVDLTVQFGHSAWK